MKFVVDAQLPRRIAYLLRDHGHDAVHTLDLPEANRTTDSEILNVADRDERVVITKDADFVNSFHLSRRPEKLLLISTGNIANAQLAGLLLPNLDAIVEAFAAADFVELTRTSLITHT
jgi:predicted nuclease of predicted toxin-antitoxin system